MTNFYATKGELNIRDFVKKNKGAAWPDHLEPLNSDWSLYPYLYRPVAINFEYVDSKARFEWSIYNSNYDKLPRISIYCIGFKILIRADLPSGEYYFYDFNKVNDEYRKKITSFIQDRVKEQDERKKLLIENGWKDFNEEIYGDSGRDIFTVTRHPEFDLYLPKMKVEAFGEYFYIDLPDNEVCQRKFNEWLNAHTKSALIESSIKKLQDDRD